MGLKRWTYAVQCLPQVAENIAAEIDLHKVVRSPIRKHITGFAEESDVLGKAIFESEAQKEDQSLVLSMSKSRRKEVLHSLAPAACSNELVRPCALPAVHDVIITRVRWYLRFKLSYRDLAELARELGVSVANGANKVY